MTVAVIDNFDSFVYNLVQYIGELGYDPVVFRNDCSLEDVEQEEPDAIVISPGPGTPEDAGVSVDVVRGLVGDVPILGICLGHQVIAYAFGGTVSPAERIMHGKTSMIAHDPGFLYNGLSNPFEATRYHSLVVREDRVPDCLETNARTVDGDQEVMGIEHTDYPVFGVQFHPESILTRSGKRIIENFLRGVKK